MSKYFSVLISLYYKEKPTFFNSAMCSIAINQSEKPSEIVLVQDGPLTEELYLAVDEWKKRLGPVLKVINIKNNSGLAKALNVGLKECSYEYIARMDTDDISNEKRFESQLIYLEENNGVDVVGTYLSEIDENDKKIKSLVKFPLTHDLLYKFFSRRDPMAHPSVMFRRSFFEKSGNYPVDILLAEDTLLWYKGFLCHCKFANIPYVGLKFRRSSKFYDRRSDKTKSLRLLRYRIKKINKDLDYGMIADFYALLYFVFSISPKYIKKMLYRFFR